MIYYPTMMVVVKLQRRKRLYREIADIKRRVVALEATMQPWHLSAIDRIKLGEQDG